MNAQEYVDGVGSEEPRENTNDWTGHFFPNLESIRT